MSKNLDEILDQLKVDLSSLLAKQATASKKRKKSNRGKTLSEVMKAEVQALQSQGVRLTDISEKTDLSPSILSRWLSGNRDDIRLASVEKLCDYLGLTLERDE